MTQKLTVVVTCTDRKAAIVTDELRVRNLPPGTVENRAALWSARIESSFDKRPLRALYQGDTWAQVGRLEALARQAGYEPRLLVASAGLGLREIEYAAPAYGATFVRPHDDSVGANADQARDWWQALHQVQSESEHPTDLDGPMLWVLSESYARVIAADLLQRSKPDNLLVFGGTPEVPAEHRVPSNRALRRTLGGTATSLNLRMAARWIEFAGQEGGLFATATRDRWDEWVSSAEQHEEYGREPITDGAVIEFIQALRRTDPSLSKTRALRQLRDAGFACEQRRFGDLFSQQGAGR